MCFLASVFNKNPIVWSSDASSYKITSVAVILDMADSKGRRKLRKLTMRVKRGDFTPVPVSENYSSEGTRVGPDGWLFHRMILRSGFSAVCDAFPVV